MQRRSMSLAVRVAAGLVLAAATGAAPPAHAGSDARQATLDALESIESTESIGLRAGLADAVGNQLRVGDPVRFRFESREPVYLTTIYLDASGVMTILHTGGESSRLVPGGVTIFPDPESGKRLVARPPLGRERVFAVATREPLPQDMFVDAEGRPALVHERPEDARHLARRLADYLSVLPEGSVAVASFSDEVVGEEALPRYATNEIVEYFETNTRALGRKKLDLDIQFEFGSDRLTPQAREDLDELGRALEHPAMRNRHFELAGHTDDVGSADYNMQLSKRRARSAYDYLMSRYDIAPGAVEPTGYGEERPLMPGTSEEARRRNRRVVIEQLP